MSSEQGFQGVPGVPDGWELVRFRRLMFGDWYVGATGKPERWQQASASVNVYAVIRKIEVPKKYRPFANGAEYMASTLRGEAVDWKSGDTDGFYAVVSANASFVWVAFGDKVERFAWRKAFEELQFRHIDGSTSPFGVEVTGE